ncbi:hypothetical protein V3C99_003933 [Haemonchus contortus]|uniref:Uncharacterized protein n=1 Tax=Haemonchus contortus TaxID=6289 RepID=A0A7I4XZR5_HAECO|nr:Protein K07H8.5 [Haemonchus contortus]
MQMRIVLFYSVIFTNIAVSRSADSKTKGEKALRKKVTVSEASMEGDIVTPLNTKSRSVPAFNAYDHQFTSEYKMTCGSKVTAIMGIEGIARCMPEYNDIVVVQKDDEVAVQECLKIIVCTPSKRDDNVLCKPDTIRVVLPYANMLLTSNSKKELHKSAFKVSKGEIVFTNDPRCMMVFSKEHKMKHRFQNKSKKLRAILADYPGFYLQPTFYNKRRRHRMGNTISFGGDLHKGTRPLSHIKCNAECDVGQLFYYKMAANVLIYSKFFIEGATCDWIKICTRGEDGVNRRKYQCDDVDLLSIYIRNGFVVMPGAPNGTPIKFVKSTKGTQLEDSLTSRPTQIAFEYDGDRFAVWSVTREVVVSSTNMGHDGHIIIYMSDHNCLIRKKGIRDLGENNGMVYQVHQDKLINDVSTGKRVFYTYETARSRTRPRTMNTEKPTPNFSAVAPATTTRHLGIGVLSPYIGSELVRARKGWLIWMIFVGFFCGSLTALLLAALVLYINRRAVYAEWYRGMHKRYGVDPSGMSGGITGSMFGSTTSGVAPSSTIGPTTKGDTTGSTKHWDKRKGTYTYDSSHGSSSRDSSHSSAASHSRSSKRRQSSRSSKSRGSAFDSNVVNL